LSDSPQAPRSLVSIASIVAIATLLSKIAGLVRQQAIAAAFGAGPVVNAYSYAYVVPGFLLILLGGINGPFHSAMVSVLAKRDRREAAAIVETVTTVVGLVLLAVSIALIFLADPLMGLLAPGLSMDWAEASRQGISAAAFADLARTRELAALQLQIMAPIALLAGLIGIGFGTLNAADRYWLPSISPLLSSVVTIAAIGLYWLTAIGGPDGPLATLPGLNQLDLRPNSPQLLALGAGLLAAGTLGGAVLQWLVQLPDQARSGMGKLRLRWELRHPGVRDVLKVMAPATLSSGMLQVNLYTDLVFASYIPQAAAALNYANLLVQTPLGLLSNVVLVPLLPLLSRLAGLDSRQELRSRIRQSLIVVAIAMLPLSAILIPLAEPIVRAVYERGAFAPEDSALVTTVFMASSVGMFIYLGRDLMVRVFYALGDGQTPFRVSIVNIFLNAFLDWLLVPYFGAAGIVLATVGVNLVAMVALLVLLDGRIGGLPWRDWLKPFGGLLAASAIAGGGCWGTRLALETTLGTGQLWQHLIQIAGGSAIGLGLFLAIALALKLPELDQLLARFRRP
jgi:putative peptidoglycan lipid II flippase